MAVWFSEQVRDQVQVVSVRRLPGGNSSFPGTSTGGPPDSYAVIRGLWLALLLGGLVAGPASAAVLYDASLGTAPDAQGWIGLANPARVGVLQLGERQSLILNTLGNLEERAGYFNRLPPLLRAHPDAPRMDLAYSDFAVDFTMRVVAGQDVADTDPRHLDERNRGGFAVIAISEDRTGIELQFQTDQIVGLSNVDSAFPLGEAVSYDTTAALQQYRITLTADEYRLTASDRLLLTGPLRDYSDVAPAPPFGFPYTTPSFLFFGDDTPRAGAVLELARFAVAPLGDCSHDGLRNEHDFACFATIEERDATLVAIGSLPGDLNGDGRVSFADFLIVSGHFGQSDASYAQGNIDLVNGVSFADFLVFSTYFGQSGNEVVGVPEPRGAITVILVGILVVLRYARTPGLGQNLACQKC